MQQNISKCTGIIHNWQISKEIRNYIYPKPFILAGGLTPTNVIQAVTKVKPYAVDVSSGVETNVGFKDKIKVRNFIVNAKSVDMKTNYQNKLSFQFKCGRRDLNPGY